MAEPVISDMLTSISDTIKAGLPDLLDRVTDAPPEGIPNALCVWLDYGPATVEMGLLDVVLHTVTVVTAVNRKGNYPGECLTVNDTAQRVRQALRAGALSDGEAIFADEAVLVNIEVGKAAGSAYAGQQDALVAAPLVLTLETKTQINYP